MFLLKHCIIVKSEEHIVYKIHDRIENCINKIQRKDFFMKMSVFISMQTL